MTFSWQDITAIVVIALAAIYLILRIFRIGPWKRKNFCETCDTCMVEQPGQNTVEIELPEQCHPEHRERNPEHRERNPERSEGCP